MKKFISIVVWLPAVLWLAACSEPPPPPSSPAAGSLAQPAAVPPPAGRSLDTVAVTRGARLYQDHCAVCHGAQAQGAPNWQSKGPDGKPQPPPLDGAGHAWHHPGSWLRDMIKQGTVRRGGNMPSWEGKLSNADIEAVIAWIQSRWPDEIYQSWLAMDKKSRQEGVNR
jgi:mono/diheme cytochrome c family protein